MRKYAVLVDSVFIKLGVSMRNLKCTYAEVMGTTDRIWFFTHPLQ